MSGQTLDMDHLRAWIGRDETASEVLTAALVARLNATLDRKGQDGGEPGIPLLVHHCLCLPAIPTSALAGDGHPPRGGFLPPVPLPQRMWAGGEVRLVSAPRIGEIVERHSVIEDVTIKQGASGALCFVTVQHEYTSGGRQAISERQDIVYRNAPAAGGLSGRPAPTAAPKGRWQRQIITSPTLLFRYSALTFNGHRIHYDQPYATGREGYQGLVVHGPLQAMVLANLAAELYAGAPERFSFRSLSPVFCGGGLQLHASAEDETMKLWTAAPDGPVATEAHARW